MIRTSFPALLALVATLACGERPLEHADRDFTTTIDGQPVVLTYQGTHDVHQDDDPDVRLLVLVHHDGRINPVTSFDFMTAALDSASIDRPSLRLSETTMVLSPSMIMGEHIDENPERYAGANYATWDGLWRGGSDSQTTPAVSNFTVIDSLIVTVAQGFPTLRAVVQVGHSAGGQLVSRHMVATSVDDWLRARGVHMRWVVSNPSTFMYLDARRPNLGADSGFLDLSAGPPEVDGARCEDFDDYLYGLNETPPYFHRRTPEEMVADLSGKDVWLLSGADDNDPDRIDLDRGCAANLQGAHRLERAQRYFEYFGELYGEDAYATKHIEVVAGVGHDGRRMYRSQQGRAMIFIDADSAAATVEVGR